MSNHNDVDWRSIRDSNVVFKESDRIKGPITDPKLLAAIERAMETYRERLGIRERDDTSPNGNQS